MVQDSNNPSNKNVNKKYHSSRQLHITFHNPNTTEETAKFLAKLLVKSLMEQVSFGRERG